MYDVLHRNFDFRINGGIRSQSLNVKIINAQLISRIGFVADEMKAVQNQTRAAIDNRAIQIENPDALCIADARASMQSAEYYVGYSVNGLVGEVMFYINQIEQYYFYPLIQVLQLESNIIQWTLLSEMHRYNPVTDIGRLITRLEDDYFVLLTLYEISVNNIIREMNQIENHVNTEVKQSMFPQLDAIRDYFAFSNQIIMNALTVCNA